MSDEKFFDFRNAMIDLIPEDAEGFLHLESHHFEACLQLAAMYSAIHMEGVDFVAHAIEFYCAAEELLQEPMPEDHPPLTMLSGGKRTDGPR